jgi:hypothetical protein
MLEFVLLCGCVVLPVLLALVIAYSGTALLGLTVLNVFVVASATLPVFFFGKLLGELPETFTAEHLYVVGYAELGLLAMIGGAYLAWRPLQHARAYGAGATLLHAPEHITEKLGWLSFGVGIGAELLFALMSDIPTISTALHAVSALGRIGLFILLVDAFKRGVWSPFFTALGVFMLISLIGSMSSGHTFLRMYVLIPLFVIWVTFTGVTTKNVITALLSMSLLTMAVSAWLQTRILIRSGSLEHLPLFEQLSVFFTEYFANIHFPNATAFIGTLRERVDMTDILAAQVRHQPLNEPYALGQTIYSSFYTLIPRAVWADKPEVAGGAAFFERYTGLTRPVDDATSIGLPYPFELYANGGAFTVVLGLGIIGYVCARMELKLFEAPRNLGYFWALALVTVVLCEGGQRTDVVLPALVASAAVAYAFGWIIERLGWNETRMRYAKMRLNRTGRTR